MNGFILIILASLCWALDTLIRYPLLFKGVSAYKIVLLEHLFLALIFTTYFLVKNKLTKFKLTLNEVISLAFIGMLGSALATLCFTQSFFLINPTIVIILQKLQPVVVVLVARIALKEMPSSTFLKWSLLAVFATLIMISEDILKIDDLSSNKPFGYVLAFVSVLIWGICTVVGKKLSLTKLDTTQIMGGRFVFGLLGMIFIGLVAGPMLIGPGPSISNIFYDFHDLAFKILGLVFLSGILGMGLYYLGLKKIKAQNAAIAELFFPVCATLINWVFLDQPLSVWQLIGASLLMFSSIKIQSISKISGE